MPDIGAVGINLAVSIGVALLVVLIAFACGVAIGKHRVIDIAWGLGFAAIAVATFFLAAGHGSVGSRVLAPALTIVWGVRLATHIYLRGRGAPEDPRYAQLLAAASGNPTVYALTRVYLTQAAVMWFVSWPVQVAAYDPDGLSAWIIPGVLVWVIGFGFESIGDAQLAAFRRDPAKKGTVLDTGLWAWTRHPNYFGDAAMWWGLTLLACRSWWGLATIPSALAMTYFLMNKTGKPLLEKYMSDRPGYRDYVERTSGFFPRPPKRA